MQERDYQFRQDPPDIGYLELPFPSLGDYLSFLNGPRDEPTTHVNSRAPFKLAELTKEYGPVFSLRHGPRYFVVIGRYQAAMDIMEKEGASIADRPRLIAAAETLSGGMRVVSSRSGERLRKIRRWCFSGLHAYFVLIF